MSKYGGREIKRLVMKGKGRKLNRANKPAAGITYVAIHVAILVFTVAFVFFIPFHYFGTVKVTE
jgi:hypothetical protein